MLGEKLNVTFKRTIWFGNTEEKLKTFLTLIKISHLVSLLVLELGGLSQT